MGFVGFRSWRRPKPTYVFHKAQDGEFPSQERRNRFAVVLGLFKIMYHVSKRIDLKRLVYGGRKDGCGIY
jgi:hypothetical protein